MGSMICRSCGDANLDDALFCAKCSADLSDYQESSEARKDVSRASRPVSQGASISNAAKAVKSAVFSGVGYKDAAAFRYLLEDPGEDNPVLEQPRGIEEDDDEGPISVREESLLAKLDRMEEDIASRLSETKAALDLENEKLTIDSEWNTKEHNLVSMSSTLDDLIVDLLDAEINEYLSPDLIHPDETGFPAPQPNNSVKKHKNTGQYIIDALVIIALTIAIFLVGMTVGLWGSQTLGF